MSKDFDLPEDAPRIDVRFLGVDPDSKLATCEFFGLDKPKIVRRGYSTPGRATQAAVFLYMTLGLPSDDDTVNKWLEARSFPPLAIARAAGTPDKAFPINEEGAAREKTTP